MPDAPLLRVREIRLLERPVRLRIPFRYGAVTLREAPQAFVRVRIECGSAHAWGVAAEMLAPKWFDKNPDLDDAENIEQLRTALALAAPSYLCGPAASAFAHSGRAREEAVSGAARAGLTALAAGFGPALIDRAVLDALARIAGTSFFDAVRRNLAGIRLDEVAPELGAFDTDAFLACLCPAGRVDARHTVGLTDPLTRSDASGSGVDDGLPVSLEQVVARYGNRWFKVKIGGDPESDVERLRAVSRVLGHATCGDYRVTLDGNEQYAHAQALDDLLHRLANDDSLAAFRRAIAFLEQPLHRDTALEVDLNRIACPYPLVIDESDDAFDAFPRARACGYDGVSSKQCKGIYKSIANAARCVVWNADAGRTRYFLTGEDLTCQGGVSVQQDLALVSLLGIGHVERNGHHFAGPMPGAPAAEHRAFLAAHPDLYQPCDGRACLRIDGGRIALGSLACVGFAHAADPDFASMQEMAVPAAE